MPVEPPFCIYCAPRPADLCCASMCDVSSHAACAAQLSPWGRHAVQSCCAHSHSAQAGIVVLGHPDQWQYTSNSPCTSSWRPSPEIWGKGVHLHPLHAREHLAGLRTLRPLPHGQQGVGRKAHIPAGVVHVEVVHLQALHVPRPLPQLRLQLQAPIHGAQAAAHLRSALLWHLCRPLVGHGGTPMHWPILQQQCQHLGQALQQPQRQLGQSEPTWYQCPACLNPVAKCKGVMPARLTTVTGIRGAWAVPFRPKPAHTLLGSREEPSKGLGHITR